MELSQLPVIINNYLSIDNFDELQKQAPIIEMTIQNLSLEDLSDSRLSSVITNNILSPFEQRIVTLSMDPEQDNRRQTRKNEYIKMSSLLKDIRVRVLQDYKTLLTGSDHLSYYQEKLHSTKSQRRDFLIEPYFEDESYPIDVISSEMFIKMLSKSYKETLAYFKNASQLSNNKEKFEQELYQFINEAKEKLASLSDENDAVKDLIEKLKNKDESLYIGIKVHTDDWVRDLEDEHSEKLIHLQSENEKISKHTEVLKSLVEKLTQSYLFLHKFDEKKTIPITVFGDSNLEKLKAFYSEITPFLPPSIEEVTFIKTFIYDNDIKEKINLTNANNNNFADLITKLKSYFSESITKSGYNQWWSDRFLFNGAEKDSRAISTMRSNTKKMPDRKPDQRQTIANIVKVFKANPQ